MDSLILITTTCNPDFIAFHRTLTYVINITQ